MQELYIQDTIYIKDWRGLRN